MSIVVPKYQTQRPVDRPMPGPTVQAGPGPSMAPYQAQAEIGQGIRAIGATTQEAANAVTDLVKKVTDEQDQVQYDNAYAGVADTQYDIIKAVRQLKGQKAVLAAEDATKEYDERTKKILYERPNPRLVNRYEKLQKQAKLEFRRALDGHIAAQSKVAADEGYKLFMRGVSSKILDTMQTETYGPQVDDLLGLGAARIQDYLAAEGLTDPAHPEQSLFIEEQAIREWTSDTHIRVLTMLTEEKHFDEAFGYLDHFRGEGSINETTLIPVLEKMKQGVDKQVAQDLADDIKTQSRGSIAVGLNALDAQAEELQLSPAVRAAALKNLIGSYKADEEARLTADGPTLSTFLEAVSTAVIDRTAIPSARDDAYSLADTQPKTRAEAAKFEAQAREHRLATQRAYRAQRDQLAQQTYNEFVHGLTLPQKVAMTQAQVEADYADAGPLLLPKVIGDWHKAQGVVAVKSGTTYKQVMSDIENLVASPELGLSSKRMKRGQDTEQEKVQKALERDYLAYRDPDDVRKPPTQEWWQRKAAIAKIRVQQESTLGGLYTPDPVSITAAELRRLKYDMPMIKVRTPTVRLQGHGDELFPLTPKLEQMLEEHPERMVELPNYTKAEQYGPEEVRRLTPVLNRWLRINTLAYGGQVDPGAE